MESYFHGASSGLDPLISYCRQALKINSDKTIVPVEFPKSSASFFLIDTGLPRKTEPFVQLFLSKCADDYYNERIADELNPYVDDAITAYLGARETELLTLVHSISYFQYRYFKEMIPDKFLKVWLDGLASPLYKLKLCGGGGGGFILGYSLDRSLAFQKLSAQQYRLIPLDM